MIINNPKSCLLGSCKPSLGHTEVSGHTDPLVSLHKQLPPEVERELTPRPALSRWGQLCHRATLLHTHASKSYSIHQPHAAKRQRPAQPFVPAPGSGCLCPGGSEAPHKADSLVGLGRGPPPDPLSTLSEGVQRRRDVEILPSPWARESTSRPCHRFSAERSALKTKRQAALRKLGLPKKRCRRNASRRRPRTGTSARAPGRAACAQSRRASSPGLTSHA